MNPAAKGDAQLYLNVPYEEKWSAKELGARWDSILRMWYVPYGYNINEFKKWWPRTLATKMEALHDPRPAKKTKPPTEAQARRTATKRNKRAAKQASKQTSIDTEPQWKRDLAHATRMAALLGGNDDPPF